MAIEGPPVVAAPVPDVELSRRWINLADERLGARAILASDDFFADKSRLLSAAPAVFVPGKYDDHGKWMDGWESRRKRVTGHDFCIVRLALPGAIKGFDIDTSHFTGNFPPAASIDACLSRGDPTKTTRWTEILPAIGLSGNTHHLHAIENDGAWSHVRLNIFPDGGVARLRIYGQVARDWSKIGRKRQVDLAAVVNGARLIGCSDQHYGSPLNMLYPGIGATMGEGWETHRRREPGNEWAIFALGHRGIVGRIEVDTTHFKGNYPDRCSIQAMAIAGGTEQSIITQSMFWPTLLPERKLQMDRLHVFQKEVVELGPISHIRFNNIPDGGVNRLRLFGTMA